MTDKCELCGFPTKTDEEYGTHCTNEQCNNAALKEEISHDGLLTEEKLKSLRGVPTHKIIFGTESRGRICAEIPIHYTKSQSKDLVKSLIDVLAESMMYAKEKGIDTSPIRGKKNVE